MYNKPYNKKHYRLSRNKYIMGGEDNVYNAPKYLGLDISQWKNVSDSMTPIYGSWLELKNLYKNPSWENAGWTGLSIISEIPILKGLKFIKSAKLAKAAKLQKLEKTTKQLEAMNRTPQINPRKKANLILKNYNNLMEYNNSSIVNNVWDNYRKTFWKDLPKEIGQDAFVGYTTEYYRTPQSIMNK